MLYGGGVSKRRINGQGKGEFLLLVGFGGCFAFLK
jgi:hypothetical protein